MLKGVKKRPRHQQRLKTRVRCLECRAWFYPWRTVRPPKQGPCCSIRCAQRRLGRQRKGHPIPHIDRMVSRTLERARAKLKADVFARFGALTAREAELFNWAYVKGRQLTLSRRVNYFKRLPEVESVA
jgi:hypothetical protein